MVDLKPQPDSLNEGIGRAQYFQGDVTDETFVKEFTHQTVSKFGHLDYLVNATGVLWFGKPKEVHFKDPSFLGAYHILANYQSFLG